MNLTRQLVAQVKRHKILHQWAVRAYSIRHPPPYRTPNMEFEFDAWNAISSLHYQGGRQIGEDNTGPHPYGVVTHNRYEACPFADSRNGLPMNITNLRLVMPHASDAYKLTTVLRNKYIAHRRLDDPRFNLVQAYLFSKFSVSLPAFLTRRTDRPVRDGDLQALETAFYMLGAAPFMLVRQMMARGDPTPLDPRPMSGQRFYELSDASRVLISSRNKACPGSPRLIREFFDVLMNGSFTGPLESVEVGRALETLGDWDRFYDYARAASRVELLVKLNQAATARALLALQENEVLAGAAERDLLRIVTDTTLRRSYVNTANGRSPSAILQTILDVLFALLQDHGEDTLNELRAMSPIGSGSSPSTLQAAEIAQRIREHSALVHGACRRDLFVVHRTLARSGWPGITEQDLLRRTGGPELETLLRGLQSGSSGIRVS